MRLDSYRLPALVAALLVGNACSSNDQAQTPDAAGDGAPAEAAPPSDGSTMVDASSDAAADGGDGGSPGDAGAVTDARAAGVAAVAGGTYSHSANYKMVWTLGEGAGDNRSSTSPKYRMTLGVAGDTQAK